MIASLRDRQTALTPPAIVRGLKPNSLVDFGHMVSCARHLPAKLRRLVVFLSVVILLTANALAQQQPSEYELKAAFLFNFAKFVEWPPDAFAQTNSPIVIGILGKNVFGDSLEKIINNRKVNDRGFEFRNFDSLTDDITNCQILFINSSEKNDFARIISALHNSSVLTVSEADGFLKEGGMINFLIEGKNIRFQISDAAAKKARLKISSKLLSLAVPSS